MKPEDLEKLYIDIKKSVDAMRETLDAQRITDPKAMEAERNKLVDEVISKVHPKLAAQPSFAERRMVWQQQGAKDGFNKNAHGEKVFLGEILRATIPEVDKGSLRPELKTIMSTLTGAQGDYLVPVEYAEEIIKLQRGQSILRRLSRIWPMATKTRNVPQQATNVTVTWTGEGAVKTPTKPTFGRLQQIAQKLAAVVKFSDELLDDNNVDVDRFIMELIAEAIALEEDRIGLAGNTGAGDPFMGVLYAVGANVITMAGATVVGDDIINVLMQMNEAYRNGATIATSTVGLRTIMKLKDANGQYIWSPPAGTIPARIWTYPYEISDQIPTNLGAGTNQTAMLFGNWKKYHYLSDRGGLEVLSSKHAGDFVTSESAFMEDETWFRFKKRMAINVALPAAFTRMLFR